MYMLDHVQIAIITVVSCIFVYCILYKWSSLHLSIVHIFLSCIATQQNVIKICYLTFFSHGTAVRDGQVWQSIALVTLWYNPHLSIPWYSGMDSGERVYSKWDTLVQSQSVCSFPWLSGMGWTGCSEWDTVGVCLSFNSHGTVDVMGWNGMDKVLQVGHFGTITIFSMVQWGGMDKV